MKRIKRSSKGIDIHSPQMVKTIFVLSSVAILAFLVMVVKYTSFSSEPKAAPRRGVEAINLCVAKFAKFYKTNSSAVLSSAAQMSYDPFMTVTVTQKCKKANSNYDGFGYIGTTVTDSDGWGFRCCARLDVISQWKNKKNDQTTAALSGNSTPTNTPVPEGTLTTNCGPQHTSCSGKYGSYLYNSNNTVSYTTLCAKDNTQPAGVGYRCAINVGSGATCNGINASVISGTPANVYYTGTTNVAYSVCWLN